MNASLVSVSLSESLLILRLWSIQENVRSTTQRRGRAWKPLGGNSFSQSPCTPSLFSTVRLTTSELLLELPSNLFSQVRQPVSKTVVYETPVSFLLLKLNCHCHNQVSSK